MAYQPIDKSPVWRPPAQTRNSSVAVGQFAVQAQQDSGGPPAPEEVKNLAFDQNRVEAMRRQHNFANVSVLAPDEQVPAPARSQLTVQPYRADVPPRSSPAAFAFTQNEGIGVGQVRSAIGQPAVQRKPLVHELTQGLQQHGDTVQRYPSIDDSGRLDSVIYIIYKNNGKTDGSNILYVGQTTKDRAFQRFYEHTKNDAWAPWYIHATQAGLVYGDDRDQWPYDYEVIETLKEVTKFETTVAEQWWLEHYLKKGVKLLNDSTPCTIENFNKRSGNTALYDPTKIGVDKSYKPSLKAK